MIGIPCRGKEHKKRLCEAIEKLTPEIYDLLMQAYGLAASVDSVNARAFQDRLTNILAQRSLPTEQGEEEMVWLEHLYTTNEGI